MPAGQNAILRSAPCTPSAARVGDFHFLRADAASPICLTRTAVLFSRMRTGRRRLIEPGIIRLRQNHIVTRIPWNRIGNQFAHQQPRDGRIAVGKVKEIFLGFFVGNRIAVHALAGRGIQLQPRESGHIESPGILR